MAQRPTKAQIDSLIEAYAKNYFAAKRNAPFPVQQRLYDRYMAIHRKMQDRYPQVDFMSDAYDRQMRNMAELWLREHPFFGPGKDW